ncbi:MAG: hypothetical protein IPG06_01945 [Haliea sp.]|nr:hypothetical protein [Haliea sp.]
MLDIKACTLNLAQNQKTLPPLLTPKRKPGFLMKTLGELQRSAVIAHQRSSSHAARASKFLTALAATTLVLLAPTVSASVLAVVFQNPPFISDSESAFSGNVSAELAGGDNVGAGSYSYVGSAFASSARGTIGAAAQMTGSGYVAGNDRLVVHSRAALDNAFIFNISGLVTFRLDVQGSFAGELGGQMTSFAELELFCGSCNATARTFWRGGNTLLNVSTSETVISSLPSNYQVWLEHTMSVTAGVPVPFEVMLEVFVTSPQTGSARALFGHTAQLGLLLPNGMTYTSQSGDYLVPDQPPTPTVSEPPIALTAFALLALLRGRRRSASERSR